MKISINLLFVAGLLTSCQSITTPTMTLNVVTDTPATSNLTNEENTEKYINWVYPPYPDMIVFQESTALYPWDNEFKWSVSKVSDDTYNMIWLSKVISYDTNGTASHKVSDVAILPSVKEKTVVAVSTCLLSGNADTEIVAFAAWNEDVKIIRYLSNQSILLAWRANQNTGKFEELPIQNVECYFE